jgi:hypothetical protein
MGKLEKMQRMLPSLYRPEVNPNVRGTLFSWSAEDDRLVQAVQDAKEQIFVKTAQLQFLDALGSNVGVFRPTEFNLADEQFRELIPTLSYRPKQVVTTIKRVLDVFFGVGNPVVRVNEINPNEIVIQIPSSVPSLRRTLKGSIHFHAYSGTIVSVDNVLKEIVIDLEESTKALLLDELDQGFLGQENAVEPILSNTPGTTGVTLQFSAVADLSKFTASGRFRMYLTNYPGSFLHDPTSPFTLTKQRGVLGQSIVAGSINPTLTMTDASGIPDAPGKLVFNFGRGTQESLITYFGRPNNTTLLIDPAYNFLNNHSTGEPINVAVTPTVSPNVDGTDYSIYLVGVTAARILAQDIVRSIVAAGVIVRFIVVEPIC